MLPRHRHLRRLNDLLARHPVVAIVGARQVGKTTIAHQLAADWPDPVTAFDLENPIDVERLRDPMLALAPLEGLVILDEVQNRPDIFPVLRVLVDRSDKTTRFLVLGSASPELLRQTSETLAGRIYEHPLHGLALDEIGPADLDRRWLRGGFPRAFLASTDAHAAEWLRGFVRTFLERDLPQLGVRIPSATLRRFWAMLAHYHGQTWNGSELARAFAVGNSTVRRYLDILTGALVLRQLQPWHENISKRQVKAPKIYIADSGVLHALLGIESPLDLDRHPKIGASWEGLAVAQVIEHLGAEREECFFWATYSGAELDLLVVRGRRRLGFEMKRSSAPRLERSMHIAVADLGLERLDVIHCGDHTYPMTDRIRAVSLRRLIEDVAPLSTH